MLEPGNYYPQRDGRIAVIDDGQPASAWVAGQLGRRVVKAFNNLQADHLHTAALPAGTPGRVALPVAGDDPAAKDKVMKLIDQFGFDPVDAGGLDESWRQQDGTPVYGTALDVDGVRAALAAAASDRDGDRSDPAGAAGARRPRGDRPSSACARPWTSGAALSTVRSGVCATPCPELGCPRLRTVSEVPPASSASLGDGLAADGDSRRLMGAHPPRWGG